MFGVQFYPTPKELVYRMVEPYLEQMRDGEWYFPGKGKLLEPSAGKGDILDFLTAKVEWKDRDSFKERFPKWGYMVQGWEKRDIIAIEIDTELRMILQGKGYTVVDSDFLQYSGDYDNFDTILMNPPFENGVDHILHAWDILKPSQAGRIACVLNSETVRNPYTQKRKRLLALIKDHGRCEHVGQVFKEAEVPSDIECCIVWLQKEASETSQNFDGIRFQWDEGVDEVPFTSNSPAVRDLIASVVSQYDAARASLEQMAKIRQQFHFYASPLLTQYNRYDSEKNLGKSLPEQLESLKECAWRYVFDKTKLGEISTSKYQKKFITYQGQQKRMAFTVRNINELLAFFFDNMRGIIFEGIVDVFDKACANHENRVFAEGWKTNKSYRLNSKIIYPLGLYTGSRYNADWDFVNDLDKVCCYLTGREIKGIRSIQGAIDNHLDAVANTKRGLGEPTRYSELFFSTFFSIRIYKKGTVHLTFREQSLCDDLNKYAAQGKGWMIGGGY